MRTILSCFLSIIILSALEGQALDSAGCTGAVGDVKYSILDEAAFQAENGPCWVLLDGRDIADTRLSALIGQTSLPDARGYFIRAVDTRTSNRIDKDRNPGQVGTIQNDVLGQHSHNEAGYGLIKKSIVGERWTGKDHDEVGSGVEPNIAAAPKDMKTVGGSETRPKNINLYLYIRIN